MENDKSCTKSGCPLILNRRSFLASAGAVAMAAKTGSLDFASSLLAAQPNTAGKPVVQVLFVRPKVKGYWMGWPGAAYDIEARQAEYTKILEKAAKKFDVRLDVRNEPIYSESEVGACLEKLKKQPPDGLVVTNMCLHHGSSGAWPHVNKIASTKLQRNVGKSRRLSLALWGRPSPVIFREPGISPASIPPRRRTSTGLNSASECSVPSGK